MNTRLLIRPDALHPMPAMPTAGRVISDRQGVAVIVTQNSIHNMFRPQIPELHCLPCPDPMGPKPADPEFFAIKEGDMRPIHPASILLAAFIRPPRFAPVARGTHGRDCRERPAVKNKGDYNIINSFEGGLSLWPRSPATSRQISQRRELPSMALRLFASSFSMNSKDGHGRAIR